jgi:hypothetical protein
MPRLPQPAATANSHVQCGTATEIPLIVGSATILQAAKAASSIGSGSRVLPEAPAETFGEVAKSFRRLPENGVLRFQFSNALFELLGLALVALVSNLFAVRTPSFVLRLLFGRGVPALFVRLGRFELWPELASLIALPSPGRADHRRPSCDDETVLLPHVAAIAAAICASV